MTWRCYWLIQAVSASRTKCGGCDSDGMGRGHPYEKKPGSPHAWTAEPNLNTWKMPHLPRRSRFRTERRLRALASCLLS
jgi:hypothetical protein